jgi:hypothetical protein
MLKLSFTTFLSVHSGSEHIKRMATPPMPFSHKRFSMGTEANGLL